MDLDFEASCCVYCLWILKFAPAKGACQIVALILLIQKVLFDLISFSFCFSKANLRWQHFKVYKEYSPIFTERQHNVRPTQLSHSSTFRC